MANISAKLDSVILDIIRRRRFRVIVSRLLRALVDVAIFGLLASVAFGTWAASAGLGNSGWLLFFIGLGLCSTAYVFLVVTKDSSLTAVAVLLDQRLGFHDRVSSSLKFAQKSERTPFMEAHLAETAAFLAKDADRVLPFPAIKRGRALALFLALGLVALMPHADRSVISKTDRVRKQRARIEAAHDLAKDLEQLRQESDLRGLKKLSEMVALVESEVNRQIEILAPKDLIPPDDPEQPDQTKTPGRTIDDDSDDSTARPDKIGAVTGEIGDGIHLSNVATYQPMGKFDSFPQAAYTEAFAELDGYVLDDQLTSRELANLAEHLDDTAGKLNNYGYAKDLDAVNMERALLSPDGEEIAKSQKFNAFEKALAPLQHKSFSEFLKRYAAHVGNKALGKARHELKESQNKQAELFNVSAPPPKNAKFSLTKTGDKPTPDMQVLQGGQNQDSGTASQVAAQSKAGKANKQAGQAQGTQLGGAGAGMGAATRSGAAVPVLPRAEGGEYLPLKGKLGDGETIVQIINDRGKHNIAARTKGPVSYHDIFVEYSQAAEAKLNSEQVPLHMRDYIRDYFRSIRPGLE